MNDELKLILEQIIIQGEKLEERLTTLEKSFERHILMNNNAKVGLPYFLGLDWKVWAMFGIIFLDCLYDILTNHLSIWPIVDKLIGL